MDRASSAIGAAPLMQEQLKVASFWSQLDTNGREDDDKGDDNVVNKDDNNNDVMDEMPMGKRRDYSILPGQRRSNWSLPGEGGGPLPLVPPPWVGGGRWGRGCQK